MILVSGAVVEAIGGELHVSVGMDRILVLEPGIRATRQANGILLSSHGKRSFFLGDHAVSGPTLITLTAGGWRVAETSIKGTELRAALPRKGVVTQDDPIQDPADPALDPDPDTPEEALKKMLEADYQVRGQLQLPTQAKPTVRYRRVVTGDATLVGRGVDSDTIKTLGSVSSISP